MSEAAVMLGSVPTVGLAVTAAVLASLVVLICVSMSSPCWTAVLFDADEKNCRAGLDPLVAGANQVL